MESTQSCHENWPSTFVDRPSNQKRGGIITVKMLLPWSIDLLMAKYRWDSICPRGWLTCCMRKPVASYAQVVKKCTLKRDWFYNIVLPFCPLDSQGLWQLLYPKQYPIGIDRVCPICGLVQEYWPPEETPKYRGTLLGADIQLGHGWHFPECCSVACMEWGNTIYQQDEEDFAHTFRKILLD